MSRLYSGTLRFMLLYTRISILQLYIKHYLWNLNSTHVLSLFNIFITSIWTLSRIYICISGMRERGRCVLRCSAQLCGAMRARCTCSPHSGFGRFSRSRHSLWKIHRSLPRHFPSLPTCSWIGLHTCARCFRYISF